MRAMSVRSIILTGGDVTGLGVFEKTKQKKTNPRLVIR